MKTHTILNPKVVMKISLVQIFDPKKRMYFPFSCFNPFQSGWVLFVSNNMTKNVKNLEKIAQINFSMLFPFFWFLLGAQLPAHMEVEVVRATIWAVRRSNTEGTVGSKWWKWCQDKNWQLDCNVKMGIPYLALDISAMKRDVSMKQCSHLHCSMDPEG